MLLDIFDEQLHPLTVSVSFIRCVITRLNVLKRPLSTEIGATVRLRQARPRTETYLQICPYTLQCRPAHGWVCHSYSGKSKVMWLDGRQMKVHLCLFRLAGSTSYNRVYHQWSGFTITQVKMAVIFSALLVGAKPSSCLSVTVPPLGWNPSFEASSLLISWTKYLHELSLNKLLTYKGLCMLGKGLCV